MSLFSTRTNMIHKTNLPFRLQKNTINLTGDKFLESTNIADRKRTQIELFQFVIDIKSNKKLTMPD